MALSYAVTTSTSGQTTVSVPFPYLAKLDVHVSVDGDEVSQSSLVWTSSSVITLPSALTSGKAVRVWRSTPSNELEFQAQPGPIDHRQLNNNSLQMLYVAQETADTADDAASESSANATAIHDDSVAAVAAAAAAAASATTASDAAASVGDGVSDAATSASNAASSATAAASSATAAAGSASAASSSASSAATHDTSAASHDSSSATHDTSAAGSASAASSSASSAASHDSSSATHDTSAATSAFDAAVSATNAATSEANAATSAAQAAASAGIYETFPQQVLDGTTTASPSGGLYIPLVQDNGGSAPTSWKETLTNFIASVSAGLGLGTSATKNVGTTSGTVAAGDDSRITGAEQTSHKNAANGYAGLDSGGKVASAQLPSYVDDVLEYANLAAFPSSGQSTGIIYVADDTNKTYRWSGSAYVEISPSPGSTDSVTEGSTNLYFTVARVLATALTSLSTATATAVVATDTVLAGIGKLQGQLNTLFLKLAGNQTITGGFDQTPTALTWASHTVAPKTNNMQYASNTAAITITAPATDCCVIYEVTNGTGAGAVTFSGFSVGSNTGDAFDTTSAHKFFLVMLRINSVATYRWVACQ